MKIGTKLIMILVCLSMFSVGTVGITLLLMARASITELSHDKAVATAHDYAGEIQNFLTAYWYIAETVASILESFEAFPE